jgi:tetratricopeptide (TPR) repeat protein
MDYKKEAEKVMKEATECVTTGIFRWKADYDTAATKFEKAGQFYRNAKLWTESIDAFAKAANAYFQINTFALAAKNAEEAGNVAKDQKRDKDACKYYEMAADYLQKGGKSERASALFVKAASVLTVKEKDKAIKLFKEALDIYSSNDAHHHAADVYRAFNTFLIKEKLFDEAITNVEKQVVTYQQLKQDHNKFKGMLAIIF